MADLPMGYYHEHFTMVGVWQGTFTMVGVGQEHHMGKQLVNIEGVCSAGPSLKY